MCHGYWDHAGSAATRSAAKSEPITFVSRPRGEGARGAGRRGAAPGSSPSTEKVPAGVAD